MVGRYHWLNGHECDQTLGDSEGQGSLGCCSLCGLKELDTPERLNSSNDILGLTPNEKPTKAKNKQGGLPQMKNLLQSEGKHQQNEKVSYGIKDSICKPYTRQ